MTTQSNVWRIGTVATSVSAGCTIVFDGEDSASSIVWPKNPSVSFSAGDKVLCANVFGTWFVLSRITS